jgi:hypothetical protein
VQRIDPGAVRHVGVGWPPWQLTFEQLREARELLKPRLVPVSANVVLNAAAKATEAGSDRGGTARS